MDQLEPVPVCTNDLWCTNNSVAALYSGDSKGTDEAKKNLKGWQPWPYLLGFWKKNKDRININAAILNIYEDEPIRKCS